MSNQILVSICCITYNQEDYIKKAIEGFLMQKTDFAFEILMHDDASTDKTPSIIKEYQSKHPTLIDSIYQTQNQYSKGVNVIMKNIERAKGKYIAICEGDDYWTEPLKLQKQIDYMEKNPNCSMCTHAAYRIFQNGRKSLKHVRPSIGDREFSAEGVIEGDGGLFATNSIVYPKNILQEMPDFFQSNRVFDYPLAIYLSLKGDVHYIDQYMSSYRITSSGSWTNNMRKNLDLQVQTINSINAMLEKIDEYSQYKYSKSIQKIIKRKNFQIMIAKRKFEEIKKGEMKELYDKLGFVRKAYLFSLQHFPNITLGVKNTKNYFVELISKY